MLLRALFLRPARRRPWRFVATVAGVAAGVAAVVATIAANRAAIASAREGVEEIAGHVQLEITRTGGVDEALLSRLRRVTADAHVLPVLEEVALAPALGDAVRVLGVDPLAGGHFKDFDLSPGSPPLSELVPALLRGEGTLISENLAKRMGLRVGQPLVISARSRKVDLVVLGTFRPKRMASAWDRVIFIDVAVAQELFGRVGVLSRIALIPREGKPLAELEKVARTLLPPGYQLAAPNQRGAQADRLVASLQFNLTALSGISLIIGAVLVATTLATAVVQRRFSLALARSLGASSRQLVAAVMIEAMTIGLLGGGLGVLAGFFGARLTLEAVRASVAAVISGVPATDIDLPPWLVAVGFALGIAVSLAAAVLPIWETMKTPPVQGLASERPTFLRPRAFVGMVVLAVLFLVLALVLTRLPALWGFPIPALFAALALLTALLVLTTPLLDAIAHISMRSLKSHGFGAMVRLAAAAAAAGRRRAAWAAGAVGVAVALSVAIGTMVHSFRSSVVDWTKEGMRSDIWLRPAAAASGFGIGRLDPEIVDIATRLFGASCVDPFHTATATFRGEQITLGGGEFAVVAGHGGVPFRDGRSSADVFTILARTHRAIVNEPFAYRFNVKEGDTIRVQTAIGEIERQVEGVYLDYSRHLGAVVVDRSDFLTHNPNNGPDQIAFFFPTGSDIVAARDKLQGALRGRFLVDALLVGELRHEVLAIFDRTFAITSALQIVAIIVALLAMLTVLFALLDERSQDLALIRALGGSRRQVSVVIFTEAGLLGALGASLGVSFGLAVGLLLVKVVNLQSFGWTLQFVPPWTAVARTAGGAIVACVLAGLAPALVASRREPREGLHEDG